MRITGFLSDNQVKSLHSAALQVLADTGVRVECEELLRLLEAFGASVDCSGSVARFPAALVEGLIETAEKCDTRPGYPSIGVGCGIYQSMYLDPDSGDLRHFDENTLAFYCALAAHQQAIGKAHLLDVPFVPPGMASGKLALAEKLYAWKCGAAPDGSVVYTPFCEPVLEMFKVHAQATGAKLEDVFVARGYLISPLRLARPECEQLMWFRERGLRMWIGHLPTQGGTAPVTLSGAVVLALAEQLFLHALNRCLWDDKTLRIGGTVSTIDMRRGAFCYGRPEQQRVNLAFADIASLYGCQSFGCAGCADAKNPGYEAGAQKATGALATAMACGDAGIEAGLLGTDEICSPVQMILDCELARSLNRLLSEPDATDIDQIVEEIAAVGHTGSHLGTDFTAEHFKEALFMPQTWSGEVVGTWLSKGKANEVDKARDMVHRFQEQYTPVSHISQEEETELKEIIARA